MGNCLFSEMIIYSDGLPESLLIYQVDKHGNNLDNSLKIKTPKQIKNSILPGILNHFTLEIMA